MSMPDPAATPENGNEEPEAAPVPAAVEAIDLGPPNPPQFEFTHDQESLFRDLSHKMRFVGLAFAAIGVATPIVEYMTYRSIRLDLTFVVYVIIGLLTYSAGNSFMRVVETHGRDITHVMDALRRLRWMYGLIFWLLIAALVIVAILFIWVLAGGTLVLRIG